MTVQERKLRTARLDAARKRWVHEDKLNGYSTPRIRRARRAAKPQSTLAGHVAVLGALALMVICMALVAQQGGL